MEAYIMDNGKAELSVYLKTYLYNNMVSKGTANRFIG